MKKSTKTVSAMLAFASVANIAAPVMTTFAATTTTTTTTVPAEVQTLITKAATDKSFVSFNAAYAAVIAIKDASVQAAALAKLSPVQKDIPQLSEIYSIITGYNTFVTTGIAKDFDALLARATKITNTKDQAYLYGELDKYGKAMLFKQPGYVASTDAIIAVWTAVTAKDVAKAQAAVITAQTAIATVANKDNQAYLTAMLKEATDKLATLTLSVTSVSAINNTTFEVNVTLADATTAEKLAGTKLTLKSAKTEVTASFTKVDGNVAVYTIDNKGLLQPGNGSADSTYAVTSPSLTIPTGTVTTYSEVLTGNMVKGFVYKSTDLKEAVVGATVEVSGRTVKTDAYGFYSIPTNSGLRTVTVTAPGYFQKKATDVNVSRNYSTSQNFAIDIYSQDLLYLHGVAMDEKTSAPISSAVVDLYELTGTTWTKVNTFTTAADGKYNFANKGAATTIDGVATKFFGTTPTNELELSKSYKVVINKDLTSTNFTSVYHSKEVQLNLASDSQETNMKNVSVTPVKELNKSTFQVQWTRDAETALGTNVDKADLNVELLATDGKTVLSSSLLNDLSVTSGKLTEAYDLVSNAFFKESAKGVKPHLPSGTYFLRVKDAKFDTLGQVNATTIIPVVVTEGVDNVSTLTTIEKAVKGTIDSKISNVKYTEALVNQVDASTLKAITKNDGLIGTDAVSVQYTLTQKVSGVDVVVGTVDPQAFKYTAQATGVTTAMVTSSDVPYLVKDAEYTATPVQSLIRGASTKVTAGGAVSQVTATYSSAANIDSFAISNTTATDGSTHLPATNLTVNNVKLVDKNGNVVAETGAFTVATPDYSAIEIPDNKFDGVAPGEYKVVVDLQGFKPVEGTLAKVIDFQKGKLSVDKAFEAIKTTKLSGFVRFADDNTNVADADESAEATITLYDVSGKIVAANDFGKTTVDGKPQATYSIENGVNGHISAGTYTMVVRGVGFETLTKQVTISAGDENVIDVNVTRGGQGKAKLAVRDQNNAILSSGAVILTDKYFVSDLTNVDDLAEAVSFKGEYDLGTSGAGVEWTKATADLSKGDYSLTITSNNTVKYTDTVTINDINDTYYKSITVASKVVGKVVDLTVNFAGADSALDYVVVKDKNGNIVTTGREALITSNVVALQVAANDTYTVEVYAANGKFVGTTKVTVQDFAKSVTVALDTATRD